MTEPPPPYVSNSGSLPRDSTTTRFARTHARPQRNGADYAVYLNTGQEYDGSDSGARTDEAVSWGKIKADAKQVKVSPLTAPSPSSASCLSLSTGRRSIPDSFSRLVPFPPLHLVCGPTTRQVYADATLVFPLLVAQTFAKENWDAARARGSA